MRQFDGNRKQVAWYMAHNHAISVAVKIVKKISDKIFIAQKHNIFSERRHKEQVGAKRMLKKCAGHNSEKGRRRKKERMEGHITF